MNFQLFGKQNQATRKAKSLSIIMQRKSAAEDGPFEPDAREMENASAPFILRENWRDDL
jgi:hypothetical protein